MLDTAAGEVGYTEGARGYSKYGEWAGDPYAQWCAEFLCWTVHQVDETHGTRLLKVQYPLYSARNVGRSWFIRNGRYIVRSGQVDGWGYEWFDGQQNMIGTGDYIPQPGDWVFFTWTGGKDTDHVAMIEYVTRETDGSYRIHVFEGNAPSAVARNDYALTDKRILGYGTVRDLAEITMRYGNEGTKVFALQKKLAQLGFLDVKAVNGLFGERTVEAVSAFQKAHGQKASGIAGRTMQTALNEAIRNDPISWQVQDDE